MTAVSKANSSSLNCPPQQLRMALAVGRHPHLTNFFADFVQCDRPVLRLCESAPITSNANWTRTSITLTRGKPSQTSRSHCPPQTGGPAPPAIQRCTVSWLSGFRAAVTPASRLGVETPSDARRPSASPALARGIALLFHAHIHLGSKRCGIKPRTLQTEPSRVLCRSHVGCCSRL
jgi:hypothetical protein